MKKCYIFGALGSDTGAFLPNDGDLIIAADAGIERLFELNITPELCVGDFDSAKKAPENIPVIRHPKRKNDTDLLLAVKIGFERGYKSFVIFGCLGGRLDQTVASIQTAIYILNHGGSSVFVGNGECLTAVKNGSVSFKKKQSGYISVFSYSEESVGVTEKGLSFSLDNATLSSGFPLGVSNEFISREASIEVKNGTLAVIWQGGLDDIIF